MTPEQLIEKMQDAWNNSPDAVDAMPRALRVVLQAHYDGKIDNNGYPDYDLRPEFKKFLGGK